MKNEQCGSCNSKPTPSWPLCLLLGFGAAFCDSISDSLLKSREPGDKAAGCLVKVFGKVADAAMNEIC